MHSELFVVSGIAGDGILQSQLECEFMHCMINVFVVLVVVVEFCDLKAGGDILTFK